MAFALLRITAPHFVAGAEFEKGIGGWRMMRCAPIIGYMRNWGPDRINRYLAVKGWAFEWV